MRRRMSEPSQRYVEVLMYVLIQTWLAMASLSDDKEGERGFANSVHFGSDAASAEMPGSILWRGCLEGISGIALDRFIMVVQTVILCRSKLQTACAELIAQQPISAMHGHHTRKNLNLLLQYCKSILRPIRRRAVHSTTILWV